MNNYNIVTIRGTTDRPPDPFISNNQTSKKMDYIGIINYVLAANPANRINPNSLLYRLALRQWFSDIKGTTIRPEIPQWFCGWPNTTRIYTNIAGQPYYLRPEPSSFYPPASFFYEPTTTFIPELTSGITSFIPLTSVICGDDICLDYGLPGGYGYTLCLGPCFELGAFIDWASAFESVVNAAVSAAGELSGFDTTCLELQEKLSYLFKAFLGAMAQFGISGNTGINWIYGLPSYQRLVLEGYVTAIRLVLEKYKEHECSEENIPEGLDIYFD